MKMKRILMGLVMVGVVVAGGIYSTGAFFSDEETSSGNTFAAGEIDLKVDHTYASYRDYDCHTCGVVLISDPTNLVVEKNNVEIEPFDAVYAWVHPAWTAEEDSTLSEAGAEWIWATNPTTVEDASNGVVYKFRKTFEWYGPATSSDLWFAVGSDNSVEVWLNGIKIGENLGEFGYKKESMLHIENQDVLDHIVQGTNTMEFIVTNFPRPGQTPEQNPGGLIYKFELDGLCEGNYYLSHCRLWTEKDLMPGDVFWNFDDLKPGDYGRNGISLHVYDNDAWACMEMTGTDIENVRIDPEFEGGDMTDDVGELSGRLQTFIWFDTDMDSEFDPLSEAGIYDGVLGPDLALPLFEPPFEPLPASQTVYLGIAWCFGELAVNPTSGAFSCDGSGETNITQTDIYEAGLSLYAEQARNNEEFVCRRSLMNGDLIQTNGFDN